MSDSFGAYRPGDGLQSWTNTLPPTVAPGPPVGGSGSPEGTVEGNPGQSYVDTDTNDLWVKICGIGKVGWRLIGKSPTAIFAGRSGAVYSGTATDPNGVLTAMGPAYYYSTTDQSQWEKTGAGLNNTGWTKFIG